MKQISKSVARLSVVGLSAILMATSCQKNTVVVESEEIQSQANFEIPPAGTPIPGKYIVVLEDDASIAAIEDYDVASSKMKINAMEMLQEYNIAASNVEHVYSNALQGFSAKLNIDEYSRLIKDPRVKYIEQDTYVTTFAGDAKVDEIAAQEITWGINRVGAANGAGKVAWVIDTGIDLDHPDLVVNTTFSRSFVSGLSSPDDANGHGTHVAGTIAARNNTIGVVGVAYGATVISVRVLDGNGSGSTSGVINGVDYVSANASAGHACNMSLGGGASTTLDNAVKNAAAKGIFFAIAAGNSSVFAGNSSPARVNGTRIYTVSAIDINDRFASFSNFGNPPIDFAGPGVGVKSTYKNGTYATLSGTSMATPHICGILLLRQGSPRINGYAINDPDGVRDPIGIR